MRSIPGTDITSYVDSSTGLLVEGAVGSVGTGLPTTANEFQDGARIIDRSTSIWYTNYGTKAAPVWVAEIATAVVTLAAADIIAMYTTPVQIVASMGSKAIIVDSMELVITRTSTAFTGGGVVGVQYDSTANGAGTLTTANIAATVVTGSAGTTYTKRIPVVLSDVATASIAGKGLFISNATAVFAAGTGTAQVIVKYHLV